MRNYHISKFWFISNHINYNISLKACWKAFPTFQLTIFHHVKLSYIIYQCLVPINGFNNQSRPTFGSYKWISIVQKWKFSKYRILSHQIYQVLFQQCCTISKQIEMKTYVKRIKLRDLPSKIIQSCLSSIFTIKYWHNNILIFTFSNLNNWLRTELRT